VKGRKRHVVVDTEGLVLQALVSEAHYHDGTVGTWLLSGLKERFPRLKKLWADGTYAGTFVEQAAAIDIEVEITTRLSERPGFQVIAHRWVSERTFAWLGNYRRLSRYTCKTRWIIQNHLDRQENRSKLNALQREEAFNRDAVRFGNQFVCGAGVWVAAAQETHPVAQDQGEGAVESTSPKAPSTPQDP